MASIARKVHDVNCLLLFLFCLRQKIGGKDPALITQRRSFTKIAMIARFLLPKPLSLALILISRLSFIVGYTSFFTRRLLSRQTCIRSSNIAPETVIQYRIELVDGIKNINKDSWNSLLPEDASPFMRYEWFELLENSDCASVKAGWQPVHFTVYSNTSSNVVDTQLTFEEKLIMALPLYVKYNGQGEFIFDYAWEEYAERALGMRYHPKLLSAVPFTPATGCRLLSDPSLTEVQYSALTRELLLVIQNFASKNRLSGVHVNFMLNREVSTFLAQQFDWRNTIQFRWRNFNNETGQPFTSFDENLSCFTSKRRTKIRSERRKVLAEGVKIEVINGDDPVATEDFYLQMHDLYLTTVEKKWGTAYLSPELFSSLSKASAEFRSKLLFIIARNQETNEIIAGTINFRSKTHLYGRYWGAFQYVPNLHFELCYYQTIEYCIKHGLQYMEPGAGGGDFKLVRGFGPYIIHSVHWFTNPILKEAVGQFLVQERANNQVCILSPIRLLFSAISVCCCC